VNWELFYVMGLAIGSTDTAAPMLVRVERLRSRHHAERLKPERHRWWDQLAADVGGKVLPV
jgi:hypothetical protein